MAYIYPFESTDERTKQLVWAKGRPVPDQNGQSFSPDQWRYDICGQPIQYADHGNTNSKYGWEIDHIKPVALNGTNDLDNLQPLQWQNNRAKGDSYPWP